MAIYLGNTLVDTRIDNTVEPEEKWTPPADWPDYKSIYDNDVTPPEAVSAGATYKTMLILGEDAYLSGIQFVSGRYIKTSDGRLISRTANMYIQRPSGHDVWWVIVYTTTASFEPPLPTDSTYYWSWLLGVYAPDITITGSRRFSGQKKLQMVVCNILNASSDRAPFYGTHLLQCLQANQINVPPVASNSYELLGTSYLLKKINSDVVFNFTSTGVGRLFSNCYSLKKIDFDLNCANCTSVAYMFNNCIHLEYIKSLNMSKATDASYLFNGCRLLKKIPSIDTHSLKTASYMFAGVLDKITEIPTLETSALVNCGHMFENCRWVKEFPDITSVSVSNMDSMFAGCFSMKAPPNFTSLSAVVSPASMFSNCLSMESCMDTLDLPVAVNLNSTFNNCYSLKNPPTTINVPTASGLVQTFYHCTSLTAAPETINCPNVKSMQNMFVGCTSMINGPVTMDISNVTNATSMFDMCYRLETLPDVMDFSSISAVSTMNYVFRYCQSLKRIPTHFSGPNKSFAYTFDFSASANVLPECIATFDSGGNINGGMAYYINAVTNASYTRTMKFSTSIKNNFTTNERTAIAVAFTAKGWTLSW